MTEAPIRLDLLIDYVQERQPRGEAVDHLAEAVLTSRYMNELADHLMRHFVERARHSGVSWNAIGRTMGVTKQAVQQRFLLPAPDVFDQLGDILGDNTRARLSDTAARAIDRSLHEAQELNHGFIGTEHLLLALTHDTTARAATVLENCGVGLVTLRGTITDMVGTGHHEQGHLTPFTPRARTSLASAAAQPAREAPIGTEHLLLGLIDEGEGVAAQLLRNHGLTHASVNQSLTELRTADGHAADPTKNED